MAGTAGPPAEEFGNITEVTGNIEERKRQELGA